MISIKKPRCSASRSTLVRSLYFFVCPIFYYIGYVTVKRLAYFVENKAIVSHDFIFVVFIDYVIVYIASFGQLIPCNVALTKEFINL